MRYELKEKFSNLTKEYVSLYEDVISSLGNDIKDYHDPKYYGCYTTMYKYEREEMFKDLYEIKKLLVNLNIQINK